MKIALLQMTLSCILNSNRLLCRRSTVGDLDPGDMGLEVQAQERVPI